MKSLYTSLLILLFSQISISQPFEGIINYNINYDVVEQERADLEIYKSMIPTEMKLFMKGPSSMLQFVGGATEGILGDILLRSDEKVIYSIFHSTSTYTKTPLSSINSNADKSLKAIKTDSTETIQGYLCEKYVIKDASEGTETALWCAKAINTTSSKIMGYFLESMTEISVAGIEGLPLKIMFRGKEFNLTIAAFNKESKVLTPTLLTVPKTYKISKADPQLH